jgi:hypothetical protein
LTQVEPIRLSQRDLAIIESVGVYRFLTSFQIEALHFKDIRHRSLSDAAIDAKQASRHRTASNRLAQLVGAAFLSRTFTYPRSNDQPDGGHKTAVYYLTPGNVRHVKQYLQRKGRLSEFEHLDIQLTTTKYNFSAFFLSHELAISDFFLALESATQHSGQGQLRFWERLSPIQKELSKKFTAAKVIMDANGRERTSKITLTFNPDAFFCFQHADDSHAFYFLEYDNDTKALERVENQLGGYLAYRSKGFFAELLDHYGQKYLFTLPPDIRERASFQVLVVTAHEDRRNALLRLANALEPNHLFRVASLDSITPDTILKRIWFAGPAYTPIAHEEQNLSPNISLRVKAQWLQEQVAKLKPISLAE